MGRAGRLHLAHVAAMAARQAAFGTLAAAGHLYTGGRPAECFRLRWGGTGMPGAADVPVWALGLGGMLQDLQATAGSGFYMVKYYCKVRRGGALLLDTLIGCGLPDDGCLCCMLCRARPTSSFGALLRD